MLFVKIIFNIALQLNFVYAALSGLADVEAVPHPHPTVIEPIAAKCNSSDYGLTIRQPFMDMRVENERPLHFMQEPERQWIFALHGNELYHLRVSRREKTLTLVGLLTGGGASELNPLNAQVIYWQEHFIIAVELEQYLEIYMLHITDIEQSIRSAKAAAANATINRYEPIQQLLLAGSGRLQAFHFIKLEQQHVMLVLAMAFAAEQQARIHTFEWTHTYFEQLEELHLPLIRTLQVIGADKKYLIVSRAMGQQQQQSKLIISVYEVQMPTLQLRRTQTLRVTADMLHIFTYRARNYLIACANSRTAAQHCTYLRMRHGQFEAHRQKPLALDRLVAAGNFLVGARQNEIFIFPHGQFDCQLSYSTNETNVTAIMPLTSQTGETFIVLSYKQRLYTLVRMVELEMGMLERSANATDAAEDMGALQQHKRLLESAISSLRSLLLQRRTNMDVLRKIVLARTPKLRALTLRQPVRVNAGRIQAIVLQDENVRSPLQLLQRVKEMAQRYGKQRTVRSMAQNFTVDVTPRLRVQQLSVKNLIYKGRLFKGFFLDNTNKAQTILSVRPPLTTNVLRTQQLLTHQGSQPRQPRSVDATNAHAALQIGELNVNAINGVAWTDFYSALFLKNRDKTIAGRLILQANAVVKELHTTQLNGAEVAQLFNLRRPQLIQSDIIISRFFVRQLQAACLNNLSFSEEVVFRGHDSFVETPVRMHQISIAGDLLLLANKTREKRLDAAEMPAEFQQSYTGRITLNGTLRINNLLRDDLRQTRILLNGANFTVEALKAQYLLKHTPQNFSTPVRFGNAKVTLPTLTTDYLNGHPTTEHLRTTPQQHVKQPFHIVFMSAKIDGDVVCSNCSTNVAQLSANAVLHGEIANITGTKHFQAPITVDHGMTLLLNALPVSDLVLKSQLATSGYDFSGKKSVATLVISDHATVERHLNVSYLNNLDLRELLNLDYQMDELTLRNTLETANIIFHTLNDICFDDILKRFSVWNDRLVLHKDLIIEGNAKFAKNLAVQFVNGIEWDAYQASLVRFNETTPIYGRKQFSMALSVAEALHTPTINDVNMLADFMRILSRTRPQLITGEYTYGSLQLSNLDVSWINGVPISAFINTQSQHVIIQGDLLLPQLTVRANVSGQGALQMDFEAVPERLAQLPLRDWRALLVLGNADWNATNSLQYDRLRYLHKNAVKRGGSQVISGNVKLQRPVINKMLTKTAFPPDIDFAVLTKDALLKNSSATQVVMATKTFVGPLQMRITEALADCHVQMLNNIDVLRFNASLHRLSSGEPIVGPLRFQTPPFIERLNLQGFINGISVEQIYTLSNETLPLPPVMLRQLTVEEALELDTMNGMSLDSLLANRVTKDGEALELYGFLTFENLVLGDQILLQSINGIPIDNLVYTHSDHLQAITGAKELEGGLVLGGPVHVLQLNGNDLSDSYQQSVFTHQNHAFDSLTVDEAIFDGGLVFSNLELMPLGSVRAANDTQKYEGINAIRRELQNLSNTLENANSKQHLMYLDYDYQAELVWRMPTEAVVETTYYEINRPTMCERQLLQVQRAKLSKRWYLRNITSSLITDSAHGFSVKAVNYCKLEYRKVKSKVTITGAKLTSDFGMRKFIESVAIYAAPQHTNNAIVYILLHAIDLSHTKRNEVRILRIDNSRNDIDDWQSISLGVGTKMRLFAFGNYTALITTALLGTRPALSIYEFVPETQKFEFSQTIDGDYDVIEMAALRTGNGSDKYHLLLSCKRCQRIFIYERTTELQAEAEPYQIFQIVSLKSFIDKLFVFTVSDGSKYLLVLSEQEQDYYHLYRYAYVQGWQHFTYGYFRQIQMAVPLIGSSLARGEDNALLLLCGGGDYSKCGLIRALVQN